MNIKNITIIFGYIILALGIVSGSFFYFKRINNSQKELTQEQSVMLNKPFSFSAAITEITSKGQDGDEIGKGVCLGDIYNLALRSSISSTFIDGEEDSEFQGRIIDCARKNNLVDYQDLFYGKIKDGNDISQRINILRCALNSDYLQVSFNKEKDTLSRLFDTCLEMASKNVQTKPDSNDTSKIDFQNEYLDCQQIAESYGTFSFYTSFCGVGDSHKENNLFLCLNPLKLEKFSNITLSSEQKNFLSRNQDDFKLYLKNDFMNECLLESDYPYFSDDFIKWKMETFDSERPLSDFNEKLLNEIEEKVKQDKEGSTQSNANNDIKRVSDMRELYSALELYYNDFDSYPLKVTPGTALSNGGTTYMAVIPSNPTPWNEGICPSPGSNYIYTPSATGASYSLTFCLGSEIGNFTPGIHHVSPLGIN